MDIRSLLDNKNGEVFIKKYGNEFSYIYAKIYCGHDYFIIILCVKLIMILFVVINCRIRKKIIKKVSHLKLSNIGIVFLDCGVIICKMDP